MKHSINGTKKTLDIQHTLRLTDFEERQNKIYEFKTKLNEVEIKIRELEDLKRNNGTLNDDKLNEYLILIDTRQILEKDIMSYERSCDEVDYYVNTTSILFKYYDIVEKGKEDITNTNKEIKDKSILKYFFGETTVKDENMHLKTDDRATLLDKYMSYADVTYFKNINTDCKDQCSNCQSSNRSILINDGLIFCNDCDTVEYIIVDHERPSYRDPPKLSLGIKVIFKWLIA